MSGVVRCRSSHSYTRVPCHDNCFLESVSEACLRSRSILFYARLWLENSKADGSTASLCSVVHYLPEKSEVLKE